LAWLAVAQMLALQRSVWCAILNATISLSAYATIEPLAENKIIVQALDRKEEQQFNWANELPIDAH